MFKKYLGLMNPSERKSAGALLVMILVTAGLDMIGVASILPFMAVLMDPAQVTTSDVLNAAFIASRRAGVETIEQFLFFLGILVFVLQMTSLVMKALTIYSQTRFGLMREYSLGERLVSGYLAKPYSWFLNRNSADLGKTILSEAQIVVGSGIVPLLTLIGQGTVAVFLMFLLIAVDPSLALSVGMVLGLSYAGIYAALSGWLKRLGTVRAIANEERFKAVSEAFGAVKEIKVGGLEKIYIERFSRPAEMYAQGQATSIIIGQLPRYALEAIAFGGMLIVVLYLMAKRGGLAEALPTIALYAFAGYRLMPALQQTYMAITQLRFVTPALELLARDLNDLEPADTQKSGCLMAQLNPTQNISLNQVSYRYPTASKWAVSGLNICIPANSTVGFVGTTGSGKTTTVDLILGLLEPQEGSMTVDGQRITSANRSQWQNAIGYVPQHIYLADDTLSANIAFGIPKKDVDRSSVERAAKIANLHEFITEDLPNQYETCVGERGVRLSGGQRQRIGIARAIYRNPKVLILDEATSALDNLTEQAVMEAIKSMSSDITVILIAHRLSTVQKCDQIFLMEQGRIKCRGTYDQVMEMDKSFAAMNDVA